MQDVVVGDSGGILALLTGPSLIWLALGAAFLFGVTALILSELLCICGPNEILVISGRSHRLSDGSSMGFKVLHGGRDLRVPLLEEVSRMDTRLIPVTVEVQNAYSKGGIPLTVHAIANVKITTNQSLIRNAIERLLNMPTEEIGLIAQQTLEGVLREVVSELTPEEVNESRLKFAATLVRNAKDDFDKLGLELDVLKVQSVSDDQNYLRNLGRALIANMIRDAENAENAANQLISEAEATARQRSETASKKSEAAVVTCSNQLRGELAKLEAQAKAVENEADVAQQTARAIAEQELQGLRAELEKKRLHVDVEIPAEVDRLVAEADARATAAPVLETGRATAEALKLVADQWKQAGGAGRELFVLQNLEGLVSQAALRVERSEVRQLSVVDGGDGSSYTAAVAMHSAAVSKVLGEMGQVLGVDIVGLLRGAESPAS